MGFPEKVKIEALVRSRRRCCVCHEYKGVGIEVHHIIPRSEGGEDTLENAIPLCFDCHGAAGHYNPKHPKGTKFSRKELVRHRDEWFRHVQSSSSEPESDTSFDGYLSRHIVALDYKAVREMFDFKKDVIPFGYDYILQNELYHFFQRILEDDLPFTWQSSSQLSGYYWGDGLYNDLDEFHKQHPEFNNELERPLRKEDFEDGTVKSSILKAVVESGFPPDKMGKAKVQEYGCGDGPTYYIDLRRPIFVFAELRNTSSQPMKLIDVLYKKISSQSPIIPPEYEHDGVSQIAYNNLTLQPNETLLVPECVMLSPVDHDQIEKDYEVTTSIEYEWCNSVGYRANIDIDDYYYLSPLMPVCGYTVESGGEVIHLPVHSFTPSKCYLFHRMWMCGSCPHVFLHNTHGDKWDYWGEVFANSSSVKPQEHKIIIPKHVNQMKVAESDFEESRIIGLHKNGVDLLEGEIRLRRGDAYTLNVCESDEIQITGYYDAIIMKPQHYLHLRQNRSLRVELERSWS